ncbi:hypothetical protein D3C85_703360 [compost metagenome]
MRFRRLGEKTAGLFVEFGQAFEQLLERIAHLPAFLVQLAGFTAGPVFLTQLRELPPVLLGCGAAMGQQQWRFEPRQVQQ